MAEFLNRAATVDIRAELAKAPEPELTPEAFDGGDGGAGQPDTDAHKAPPPAAKPETEAAKPEPEADADDLTDAAGKPLPPDEARKIALRRERQRAKELETQLAAERETKARMEERWRTMQDMAAAQWQEEQARARQPAADADPEPDRYADPIGHNEWALRQQGAKIAAFEQDAQRRQAAEQEQRQFQAVRGAFAAKAAEFAAKEPAFKEAYDHLTQSRFNELVMMGFEPNVAQQTILREEAIIVAQWLQRGENPAAKAFELAKLRGYAPKAPEPPAAVAQPGAEKVKLQAERNAAAASLSAAGGAPPDNGLSLEDIARLPPDEFRKRMAGDGWAKMVGGRAPRMFGGR